MSKIKPTESTLKYGPWSVSKAECALLCPRKFNKTYIDKPKIKPPTNKDALIGKTVHTILEYVLAGQSIKKAFTLALNNQDLTSDELEELDGFKPNIDLFIQRFQLYSKQVKGTKPFLEQKMGVTVDWQPVDFFAKNVFMRGILDLTMDIVGKPHNIIIDHKTSKKVRDFSYYDAQFDSYMLLKKANNPKIEKIILGINYIRCNEIKIRKQPSILNDVKYITPVGNRVMHYLNQASSNLTNLNTTKRSPLCGWCDHKNSCPLWGGESSYGSKEEQITK